MVPLHFGTIALIEDAARSAGISRDMSQDNPFLFQTRIRFIDTDASGRIHYTAMFRYFESAEIEFLRSLEIFYTRGEFTFPRVHVECDFKLALMHDDLIEIEVRLTKVGRSSARFEFRALKESEVAAKGVVVVACMDRATQRSREIPPQLRAKLESALQPATQSVPR